MSVMIAAERFAAHGGLSNPSKMPGRAFGLPANECKTGQVLRRLSGSVCAKCYALKGRYAFDNVQAAQYRRLECLTRALYYPGQRETYIAAFVADLARVDSFRWFDSGDLQSIEHLQLVVDICKRTPHVSHWLPTKERGFVKAWLRDNKLPRNLNVRISAAMVGETTTAPQGVRTSTVGVSSGFQCKANTRGGKCGDCRACWSSRIANVNYPLH